MNGAMQQQQMQQAALQNYRQQQADSNALRSVFSNQENFNDGRPNIDRITPELFKAAPNSASGVLDQLQKGQTHGVELQQKQFDLAKARIGLTWQKPGSEPCTARCLLWRRSQT